MRTPSHRVVHVHCHVVWRRPPGIHSANERFIQFNNLIVFWWHSRTGRETPRPCVHHQMRMLTTMMIYICTLGTETLYLLFASGPTTIFDRKCSALRTFLSFICNEIASKSKVNVVPGIRWVWYEQLDPTVHPTIHPSVWMPRCLFIFRRRRIYGRIFSKSQVTRRCDGV